jgi:hypothetical protein
MSRADGAWWRAQVIEHDLTMRAKSLAELIPEIYRVIIAHIASAEERGVEPFQIDPPPPAFSARFKDAEQSLEYIGVVPPNAPKLVMRIRA